MSQFLTLFYSLDYRWVHVVWANNNFRLITDVMHWCVSTFAVLLKFSTDTFSEKVIWNVTKKKKILSKLKKCNFVTVEIWKIFRKIKYPLFHNTWDYRRQDNNHNCIFEHRTHRFNVAFIYKTRIQRCVLYTPVSRIMCKVADRNLFVLFLNYYCHWVGNNG